MSVPLPTQLPMISLRPIHTRKQNLRGSSNPTIVTCSSHNYQHSSRVDLVAGLAGQHHGRAALHHATSLGGVAPLHVGLFVPQLCVNPIECEEIIMFAQLHHSALVDDSDLVCILDCRQSVCDDDGRLLSRGLQSVCFVNPKPKLISMQRSDRIGRARRQR